ncbi:methyl-accepting chemotaxis protein [Aminiphilus sp.]|jgi:methyl-accepting chemotaxis protein|uniref:methyl-accepting chemotaxis protein n=1 Tax=Aminiphilus sp. TaxID=1872488 RepID=UPI00260C1535|nr:methyl-accepting chemotaxis protein [Aminiphilus sp.]
MTLRARLVFLGIGVLVAVGLMAGMAYVGARNILSEELEVSGKNGASMAVISVANWLNGKEQVVANAAENVGYMWQKFGVTSTMLLPYMELLTETNKSAGFMDIYLGFPNGKFVDGSGWIPPGNFDSRTRPWYQKAVEAKKTVYVDPYVDANTGKVILTIATPVLAADGSLIGVVGADIDLDTLVSLVVEQKISGSGYGFLVNQEGLIIAHPNEEVRLKVRITEHSDTVAPELAELGRRMTGGENGSGAYMQAGERKRLYFGPLPSGWSLGLSVPEEGLFAPIGALGKRQILVALAASLLLGAWIFFVVRGIIRPVKVLLETADAVRAGDLTSAADMCGGDELCMVGAALDGIIQGQREIFLSLRSETNRLEKEAEMLDTVADDTDKIIRAVEEKIVALQALADENAQAVESANAGIEEVASSAQGAAQASSEASHHAETLRSDAEKAGEITRSTTRRVAEMSDAFKDVAEAVARLHAQAGEIGSIVASIAGIADQTNLLALNAAIEAARAGEAGRGFAVVAEEVRKLAEESNLAARKIGDLAKGIMGGTDRAVQSADRGVSLAAQGRQDSAVMEDRIAAVLGAISAIGDQIQNVAATAQEQSAGAQEMAASIDRLAHGASRTKEEALTIRNVVTDVVQSSGELRSAAEELSGIAREFQEHLRRYRLDGGTKETLSLRG